MRTIVIAMLLAGVAGLVGTSSGTAAPANGASIGQAVSVGAIATDIRYRRYHRGRACYTKCYYELIIGPRVCHTYC